MANRKIPINKDDAKKLKTILRGARNNTERVRITIMIEYLKGKNSAEVSKGLGVSKGTIQGVMNLYIELGMSDFYKTSHKGKGESKRIKEAKVKIIEMMKAKKDEIDISDVRRELNKNGGEFNYWTTWRLTRKQLKLNYQKPFITSDKQDEFAKQIAEGRIRKAVLQVAIEEKEIDADSVKNKKTKFGQFKS